MQIKIEIGVKEDVNKISETLENAMKNDDVVSFGKTFFKVVYLSWEGIKSRKVCTVILKKLTRQQCEKVETWIDLN